MLIKQYTFPSGVPAEAVGGKDFTFLDIETTGLRRDTTILYLIGCGWYEGDEFLIRQWFNDDGVSEETMLGALRQFLSEHPAPFFTFNGEGFDIPYLNRHYELNSMTYQLDLTGSLDLYRALRPFQSLLHLPKGRQKDWESFLDIAREDTYDGGQLIKIYKQYLRSRERSLLDSLLLHNMEDVRGMEALLPLAAYVELQQEHFSVEDITLPTSSAPALGVRCRLSVPLPKPLRITAGMPEIAPTASAVFDSSACSAAASFVDISGSSMTLSIPVVSKKLRYFYPDHKNYYYLPEEDRAIHKSVGCYVDAAFRRKATPATCYINKEGIFLPVLPAQKYKGMITEPGRYQDVLPLYQAEYKDKVVFMEMQPLLEGDKDDLRHYLGDWMRSLFILEMKKAVT